MNRVIAAAAGLIFFASLAYWYHGQTERRQRSAEAIQTELADFLTARGARYGTLTYDRRRNSVAVTDISWTREVNGMARRLTLDRAEIVAGDIEAFRTLFRPARAGTGESPEAPLRLASAIDLQGLELQHGGGSVSMARFQVDGPALRPFDLSLGRRELETAGAALLAGDLGRALKFQKGSLEDLRIRSGEDGRVELAAVEVGSFDAGRLGQLAATGFAYEIGGIDARLDGLAVSNLELEHWLQALLGNTPGQTDRLQSGRAPGPGPGFDAVKLVGFHLAGEAAPAQVSIDEASLTDLVRVGELVAAGHLRIAGLETPVRGDAPWSRTLSELGYETLRLNLVSHSTYDPKANVSETREFMVEVENAGRIFGSSRLENVEIGDELRELDLRGFLAGGGPERVLGTWRLAGLELGYEDLSLIERAYELALRRLDKTPDMLAADYAARLEALRERHGGGPFVTQLSEQMTRFLETPNSIVFRVFPPEPVVLAQIALTGFDHPEELAELLGLSVTANAAP